MVMLKHMLLGVPFINSLIEGYFIMIVATINRIFMTILFIFELHI